MLGFLFFKQQQQQKKKRKERKREEKERKEVHKDSVREQFAQDLQVLENSKQIAVSWILQSVNATTMDCCILTDLSAVDYGILFHT